MSTEPLTDELLARIRAVVAPGDVIATLAQGRPNTIRSVDASGIQVETVRSSALRSGAQLVPAWMIQRAWGHLVRFGSVTGPQLVAADGLNIKRSAFVAALLARFPDVEVVSYRPVTLELVR